MLDLEFADALAMFVSGVFVTLWLVIQIGIALFMPRAQAIQQRGEDRP